jgi:hypothetical protein
MRRILGIAGAALLALTLMAPAAVAGPNDVTGVTVQSATVDKAGLVLVKGTIYCQNGLSGAEITGAVTQAIGHKTSISGGFSGWVNCMSNGPTSYEVGVYAYPGTFASGWANVQIAFGQTICNGNCWFDWFGGNDVYVKVTKR